MKLTYDCTMFKETFESEFTWLNGFMRNVGRFGYKPAVIDPTSKQQWTYEEFNRDCNKLAHALKNSGVKKSDIVFAQLFNCLQFLHFERFSIPLTSTSPRVKPLRSSITTKPLFMFTTRKSTKLR